jgi:hypothetical protein
MDSINYIVTARFEVQGPAQHSRSVDKLVHALVQALVSEQARSPDGPITITAARVQEVKADV